MNERFEHLTADALHLADDELLHIAETAQCTDAQTARIMQMAKQKAGFAVKSAKPVQHKKRLRALGVLIAAAIAAVGTTVGVSAYVTRNTNLLEKYFGADGAELISQSDLPVPSQYENEHVRVTVETMLNDGIHLNILCTFENLDGKSGFDYIPIDLDANGEPVNDIFVTGSRDGDDSNVYTGIYSVSALRENGPVYLTFAAPREEVPRSRFDGILIPVQCDQNVEMVSYISEGGDEILLSGFEMFYENSLSARENYQVNYGNAALILNDDSRVTLYSTYDNDTPVETADGTERWRHNTGVETEPKEIRGAHTEYDSFIDVSTVKAIEMDGVLYMLAE